MTFVQMSLKSIIISKMKMDVLIILVMLQKAPLILMAMESLTVLIGVQVNQKYTTEF